MGQQRDLAGFGESPSREAWSAPASTSSFSLDIAGRPITSHCSSLSRSFSVSSLSLYLSHLGRSRRTRLVPHEGAAAGLSSSPTRFVTAVAHLKYFTPPSLDRPLPPSTYLRRYLRVSPVCATKWDRICGARRSRYYLQAHRANSFSTPRFWRPSCELHRWTQQPKLRA